MIISVHIRKCAGTSFRKSICDYFSEQILLDYGDEVGSSWPSSIQKRQLSSEQIKKNETEIIDKYSIIHGHFYKKKYDFLNVEKKYITFMRNPVERILSNYYYLKRNLDRTNPDSLIVNKLGFTLEEFIQHPDNRNVQSTYLQTDDLKEFEVVGLTEKYQESIEKINSLLNVNIATDISENVNPIANKQYDVSKNIINLIEHCNATDIELYHIAKNRF